MTTRSRHETIAIIEAYFDAFTSAGKKAPPITSDYSASSPLAGQLQGASALEYFQFAGANVESIQLREHIVDGDRVVTLLTEVTTDRQVEVVAIFALQDNQIQRADVHYDIRAFGEN